MKKKGSGLLKDIRVIVLLLSVIAALLAIYVFPTPPPDAGLEGNLRFGLDLVGGSWLQLKLEGTIVGIDAPAPVTGEEVATFLEKELDTGVVYFREEGVAMFEIRKSIPKTDLSEVLTGINSSIAKGPDDEYIFEEGVTAATRDETRRVVETKLNLLGLVDIGIRTVGTNFMLVDLAGVDIGTAKEIVGEPGKFEIRIQTAGIGGDIVEGMRLEEIKNITTHVVYGGEGIDTRRVGPLPVREGEHAPWGATFALTAEGAVAVRDAAIEYGATLNPRDHELVMLLDDIVVYSAPLSPELARDLQVMPIYELRAETGTGTEGFESAKELIIHIRAGVLPVNVEIIGSGEVPAYLGAQFKEGALIAGLFAIIFAILVVFLRYREKKIVLPMSLMLFSELILIFGFAAAIKWHLDLPSIAGIIAMIGMGLDHLVIITDEVISGGRSSSSIYRKRISSAFGIIFISVTTTSVAMLALAFMALGTLRGFAIVTIVGLLIGIFITRPVYARVIEEIL
ncbi:MAG: preprotein translocase subunit SecD [Methanophagales archaeon]|nr:preprotein translocase subunit SecD [Methanophagales archaeon]